MYLLFQGYNDSRYSTRNTESKGNGNWLSYINILIQLNFIFASLYFAYGHKTKVYLTSMRFLQWKVALLPPESSTTVTSFDIIPFVILYSSCPTIINPDIL